MSAKNLVEKKKTKLLFFVNVDWFFVSHRLPLALSAINNGYEVNIATSFTRHKEYLEKMGLVVHEIKLHRSSTSLLGMIGAFFRTLVLLKKIKPDILHLVTVKPIILGSLASFFIKKKIYYVYAFSGLGTVYISKGKKAYLRRFLINNLYKLSLSNKRKKVIFQNFDDFNLISKIVSFSPNEFTFIKGSGVNLQKYKPKKSDEGLIVLFAARLLTSKGIYDFINVAKKLNHLARFAVVGDFDYENKDSISPKDFYKYVDNNDIEYWGHSNNMEVTLNKCSLVVLPSIREGMPKILLEAAASGKPVVTYDVPGCREAIINKKTGFLVPFKKLDSLIKSVEVLINNKNIRDNFGIEGRLLAEKEFDINIVIKKHLEIYNEFKNKKEFLE